MSAVDGIYAGYMTGAEGIGFSMFHFFDGVIVGTDPLGVSFDGNYSVTDDGILANVKVMVPGDRTVIQGASAGPGGMSYEVQLRLPADFTEEEFHRVDTPLGPVNLRIKKLRSLERSK